jgi:hypothetical protein
MPTLAGAAANEGAPTIASVPAPAPASGVRRVQQVHKVGWVQQVHKVFRVRLGLKVLLVQLV